MRSESSPSGITLLDHTADVGVEVQAPTLPELFARAAVGMGWLLGEERRLHSVERSEARDMALGAADLPSLLRAWLREILYWHETEGVSFRDVRFDVLTETRLEASVTLAVGRGQPVREIKGVTLHGLRAEKRGAGWFGRVIFDV